MAELDDSAPRGGSGWRWLAAALVVAALLTFLSAEQPCGRAAVVAWTVAGAAWFRSVKGRPPGHMERHALTVALTVAYALLIAAPPRFSDDLWRYLFDGRVGASGLNPFAYAPANPKVAQLAPELVAKMNFPEMRTIYPPVAQGLFALVALAGADDRGWRLLLALISVGAAWWAARDGRPSGEGDRRFWSIAAAPLVVVSAGSLGALDTTGLVVTTALLSSAVAARPILQGFWVGIGAGIKLFPALLFAALPALRRLRAAAVACAAAALLLAAAYLPIAGIGTKALGSLGTYSTAWSFNGGPVRWFAMATESLLAATGMDWSVEVPIPAVLADEGRRVVNGVPTASLYLGRDQVARAISSLVGLVALSGAVLFARQRFAGTARVVATCLLAFYATQFTVYPWYGLWLVPAAVLLGGRGAIGGAALAWCAFLPLALLTPAAVIDGGAWSEPLWVTPLLWSAVVAAGLRSRHRV